MRKDSPAAEYKQFLKTYIQIYPDILLKKRYLHFNVNLKGFSTVGVKMADK